MSESTMTSLVSRRAASCIMTRKPPMMLMTMMTIALQSATATPAKSGGSRVRRYRRSSAKRYTPAEGSEARSRMRITGVATKSGAAMIGRAMSTSRSSSTVLSSTRARSPMVIVRAQKKLKRMSPGCFRVQFRAVVEAEKKLNHRDTEDTEKTFQKKA